MHLTATVAALLSRRVMADVGCEDMSKAHRIAAGGLLFRDDAVLLVRYRDADRGTYLVGPGGELKEDENAVQAIVRETMEEPNIRVQPKRVVIIEDLICTSNKMIKVWMICEVVGGSIGRTYKAEKEGIIQDLVTKKWNDILADPIPIHNY